MSTKFKLGLDDARVLGSIFTSIGRLVYLGGPRTNYDAGVGQNMKTKLFLLTWKHLPNICVLASSTYGRSGINASILNSNGWTFINHVLDTC